MRACCISSKANILAKPKYEGNTNNCFCSRCLPFVFSRNAVIRKQDNSPEILKGQVHVPTEFSWAPKEEFVIYIDPSEDKELAGYSMLP